MRICYVCFCAAIFIFSVSSAKIVQAGNIDFDLKGKVKNYCHAYNLSIADVETINLNTSANQKLGLIYYKCKNPNGFTRTITSQNNGQLKNGAQGIDYLVSHTGWPYIDFGPTQLTTPKVTSVPGSWWFCLGVLGKMKVSIPSLPNDLMAGTYSDTITVAVAGN